MYFYAHPVYFLFKPINYGSSNYTRKRIQLYENHIQLTGTTNIERNLQDSVYVLASAINEYQKVGKIGEAPNDCDDSGALWDSGKQIFQYLKTINIRGETGQVAFDDNGDRIYAEYEVINVLDEQKKKVVGSFYYDEVGGVLNLSRIIKSDRNFPVLLSLSVCFCCRTS